MKVAIINLDVDRFGHVFADVLTLAMVCIYCCFCIMVFFIRLESHDCAFHILNSKRLLQSSAEFHAHSKRMKDHCWESLG